jgi:hypothetical protein
VIELRGAHRGGRALIVCGGPSLIAQQFDLSRLAGRGFVTFVEGKALTPRLLASGLPLDYYLMPFPEKAKDNALQQFVYKALLARYPIERMLRPECQAVARDIRARFDELFEPWQPSRPHKRFRWRPDVFLPDSPYELLRRTPSTRIIANRMLLDRYFPSHAYGDRTHYFVEAVAETTFDREQYFNPVVHDGVLHVGGGGAFLNSAAIAVYPLLHYMGFAEAYFLGMDMSMLGSMEYAAPFTFKSLAHYWWFFRRTMHVFNANYRANGWLFTRPQSEFDDLKMLWAAAPVAFTRVYDPWRHATRVDGIRTIPTAALV